MGIQSQAFERIRLVRGSRVILDRDLAVIYCVEVRVLNRAVRRNSERFPPDFMFQLKPAEWDVLKCQFGTSSWGGDRRARPLAFTEQGVAMLSSVLRSPRAVRVNIAIVRAFVRLRQAVAASAVLGRRLSEIERTLADHGAELGRHAELIQEGLEAIRRLMGEPEHRRKRIGFEVP